MEDLSISYQRYVLCQMLIMYHVFAKLIYKVGSNHRYINFFIFVCFLQVHLAADAHSSFDFSNYINRSLEEDFKVVVGIRCSFLINKLNTSVGIENMTSLLIAFLFNYFSPPIWLFVVAIKLPLEFAYYCDTSSYAGIFVLLLFDPSIFILKFCATVF